MFSGVDGSVAWLKTHLRGLFKFLFWSGKTRRNLPDSLPRVATGADHLPSYLKPEDSDQVTPIAISGASNDGKYRPVRACGRADTLSQQHFAIASTVNAGAPRRDALERLPSLPGRRI